MKRKMKLFFSVFLAVVIFIGSSISNFQLSPVLASNDGYLDFNQIEDKTLPFEYDEISAIGGGSGYGQIVTGGAISIDALDNSNNPKTSNQLVNEIKSAISNANSGDTIFIDPACVITLSEPLIINKPLTLASSRGYNGSEGAQILASVSNSINYDYMFKIQSDNARISGFRLRGNKDSNGATYCMQANNYNDSEGKEVSAKNIEIDNCDISYFLIGIQLQETTNTNVLLSEDGFKIHHNYIHQNNKPNVLNDYGYGIAVGNAYPQIYANIFHNNRHDVAATGYEKNGYEAYCNIMLEGDSDQSNFDMHANRQDPYDAKTALYKAGGFIHIHHNDIRDKTGQANIYPVGKPTTLCLVDNNRFSSNIIYGLSNSAVKQDCWDRTNSAEGYGNLIAVNNTYGGSNHVGWYVKENWDKQKTDNVTRIPSANDLLMSNVDAKLKGSWLDSTNQELDYSYGDFNGDQITDILKAEGGKWYYLPLNTGYTDHWTEINTSDMKFGTMALLPGYTDFYKYTPNMYFGNVDVGDTTDVLQATGSQWSVSYGASTPFSPYTGPGKSTDWFLYGNFGSSTSDPGTTPVTNDFNSNHTDSAVTVDGDLKEAGWDVSHELTQGKVEGVTNNVAKIGTMWDASNLYMAFDVTDSSLISNMNKDPWDVDSAEVYIDGNNSGEYDAHAVQFVFRWYDLATSTSAGSITIYKNAVVAPDGVQYVAKAKADGSGYTMEIAIPWANIGGMSVDSGKQIGITAHINDCDGVNDSSNSLCYTLDGDNDWLNCQNWAKMTLAASIPVSYDFNSNHADSAVTVDGDLKEAGWDVSHELTQGKVEGVTNNVAKIGTMWDSSNLYMAFDVTDSSLISNMNKDPWDVDSAEVYIDGNNSGEYDTHAVQFVFRWYDMATSTSVGSITIYKNAAVTPDGIQYVAKAKADGSGYTMEITIPWANIGGMSVDGGKQIGITAHINDCDGVNDSSNSICYTLDGDNDWLNCQNWAKMTLAAPTPTPTPTPTTPTPTSTPPTLTLTPTPTPTPTISTPTITPTPTPEVPQFTDVNGNWAKKAIMDMAKAGVLSGYGDGTVKPNANATRAEFITFIVKLMKVEAKTTANFSDISTSAWYMKYLSAAVDKGWVNGRTDRTFGPNDTITREEAMRIMSRVIDSLGIKYTVDISVLDTYKDSILVVAKNDVAKLVGLGIIKGSNGFLNPNARITRAEICTILERIMESYLNK